MVLNFFNKRREGNPPVWRPIRFFDNASNSLPLVVGIVSHSLNESITIHSESSVHANMIAKNCRKILVSFSLWHLVLSLGDSYDNRSVFSSAMSVASAASSAPPSATVECAVVGVGVLGTSLCKQLLRDPDLKDWKGRSIFRCWITVELPNSIVLFFFWFAVGILCPSQAFIF